MASFSVVSNVASMNAQANLLTTNLGLNKALTRLSSGFRINMSGDDAAGLAVANGYRSDVAIIGQGIRNANDGLSALQIKDGALNNISNLLDRLATLSTQSASGLTTTAQRTILNQEAQDLLSEIDREARDCRPRRGRGRELLGVREQRLGQRDDLLVIGHQRRRRERSGTHRSRHLVAGWRADGHHEHHCGYRDARWRSGSGRSAAEPAPVRDDAGAVADDQQEGC